jgi:hypothetical protein
LSGSIVFLAWSACLPWSRQTSSLRQSGGRAYGAVLKRRRRRTNTDANARIDAIAASPYALGLYLQWSWLYGGAAFISELFADDLDAPFPPLSLQFTETFFGVTIHVSPPFGTMIPRHSGDLEQGRGQIVQ